MRRCHPWFLLSVLAYCVCGFAAERQLQIAPTAPAPGGEKRVALIIGNSAYKKAPLRNPVNDARAISKALAATGFKVTVIEDATQSTMRRAIRSFGNDIQTGVVALFYYAGHGMQVRGKNYLIPVNADIEQEDEVEDQSVDANLVLAKMESARSSLNLMILDACRNNPFPRRFRSATQGLAQMEAPTGTLIAFATAPGAIAADGDGANGVYTKHLLANIGRAGLPIEQLFKEVRIGVTRETNHRQVPWESSSLIGNFSFVPGQAPAQAFKPVEPPNQAPAQADKPVEPPKLASIAPTRVAGSGVDNPRYPRVGDRWEYSYVDITTRQRRSARFEVTGVSTDGILESGGFVDAEPLQRAHSSGAQLVLTPGFLMEFSPYILSFGTPKPGEWWRSLKPPRNWDFCFVPGNTCRASGKVVGTERVTTPAGTFDTVKVVIDFNTAAQAIGNWRQGTFWYSQSAKRIVKSTYRIRAGSSGNAPDYDLELTSYKLN